MAAKAPKRDKITLEGIAVYPKLDVPDVYKDPETGQAAPPKYRTDLKMTDERLAKLNKYIEKVAAEHFPGVDLDDLNLPFKTNKDGDVLVTMSTGAEYKPPIFDAKKNDVPPEVVIGGGSTIKVAVSVNIYNKNKKNRGINFYLNSVQLIELVEGKNNRCPFDEADGYVYTGAGATANSSDDAAADDEESYAF